MMQKNGRFFFSVHFFYSRMNAIVNEQAKQNAREICMFKIIGNM
jgi:hypothetical protein